MGDRMTSSHVHTADLSEEQLQTLVEVILAVAYGDGQLGKAEHRALHGYLTRLGDDRLDHAQTDAVLLAATMNLERDGFDARLRAAKDVLAGDEAKLMVLRLAYDAAQADGLADGERSALQRAASALGLDDDVIDRIASE